MDENRFDELTTALSNSNSRRGMLRGVAAGGLAAALTAIGISRDEADAKHRRHRRHRHHKKIAIDISNNTTNGLPVGSVCKIANDCAVNLVCAGGKKKKCQGCPGGGACVDSQKCCLIGACVAGLDICV